MNAAVEIDNVSKRFRLYHEKYASLKERVVHAGHVPYEEFWALRNVSAEIPAGHTVGILGRNGSGKSTLLKCVAGILQPTEGKVVVRGQLAAMLELGAGFQPELSGRDNVYLNGSLLGFSRREIAKRFDAIVEFAELDQFIDNQVKYYSSGMYVRLGFAVAVNVEPDVLLVDEVLAVGDERFQQKCLDRVAQFQRDGRTIIVVSHAPDTLRRICEEILVIDHGEVVTLANPGEAIRAFRERMIGSGMQAPEPIEVDPETGPVPVVESARRVRLTETTIEYPGSGERPYLVSGEPLTVRVGLEVNEPLSGGQLSITVLNERNDVVFAELLDAATGGVQLDKGLGSAAFIFDAVTLLDGRFVVNIDVRDAGGVVLDVSEPATYFEVMNPGRATGIVALPMRLEVTPP
ncbi:MAG TPA: ABC transporter ATP-binding protein [Acidimicrobiales bacterium]|nr:ABC transporter ATP-binding protein [Acidimicrobiales bacterium]